MTQQQEEPPYPIATNEKAPFDKSTYLDFHYKDPKQNLFGMITFTTETQEKADKYDINEYYRDSNNYDKMVEARSSGVYKDDAEDTSEHWKGYTIIVPVIDQDIVEKMIDRFSEKHGTEFEIHEEPVTPNKLSEVLPQIKKNCDVCGKTRHESKLKDITQGVRIPKKVCSNKCATAVRL